MRKNKTIFARVPQEVYDELKRLSEKHDISISILLRRLVKNFLKNKKRLKQRRDVCEKNNEKKD